MLGRGMAGLVSRGELWLVMFRCGRLGMAKYGSLWRGDSQRKSYLNKSICSLIGK